MHKRRQRDAAVVFGNEMGFDLGTLDIPFRHLRMKKLLGAVHTYAVRLLHSLGESRDVGLEMGLWDHSDQACIPATCLRQAKPQSPYCADSMT